MELQINDLVEVQYGEHLLAGQIHTAHYGLGQYDVMIPEIGIKRFPLNCIKRILAKAPTDQEGEEQADGSGDTGSDIASILTDYSDSRTGVRDTFEIQGTETGSFGVSDLPTSNGPATEPEPEFGGGGGFSGGGGGDSWTSDPPSSESIGSSDSSEDAGRSTDSGSSDSFGGSEGGE